MCYIISMTLRHKKNPTRVRSVRLPQELWDFIENHAMGYGLSVNGILWEAIEMWAKKIDYIPIGDNSPYRGSYNARIGGHAPWPLRESLLTWLIDLDLSSDIINIDERLHWVRYADTVKTIQWLLGQLWNCSDIIPDEYREFLDRFFAIHFLKQPSNSTYASYVRILSRLPAFSKGSEKAS